VEAQNALAVYVDVDYGTGSAGLSSIATTSDNDGALDNALSAAIEVSHAEFRADWAVGTRGMTSAGSELNDNAGWRDIALEPANFHWMSGTLVAGAAAFEASIPLATLFGGSMPADGTRLAVFARLVNEDGQFMANQTVPADNAASPGTVSEVAVITLHGGGEPQCNHDGVCDAGESTASCPDDCPDTGECGDNAPFAWEDGGMYFVLVDRFFAGAASNNNPVLCSPNYWNDPYYGTRCAFTNYLPAFDYYQTWVRQWSVADAMWWAREYGIDGYRLDAIKHVPMDWLIALRTAAEAAFPNPAGGRFYMVGETYDWDSQQTLKDFVDPSTTLDGQFDFPLRKRMCEAIFTRGMSLDDFFNWWNGNDTFYGAGALMSTWIGNHDIPRAIHFASGQVNNCYEGSYVGNSWNPSSFTQPENAEPYQRLALAFGLLLTNRGVPLIYYGDEIGLAGGGDPDNRRMMTWSGLNTHQEWLRARVSKLTAIRAANLALRRGRRVTVTGGTDTFAYRLTGCGASEELYVLVNRGDFDATVSGLPAGSWTELISESSVSGGSGVSVPARDLKIFKAQP
jgi:hypothetical protein